MEVLYSKYYIWNYQYVEYYLDTDTKLNENKTIIMKADEIIQILDNAEHIELPKLSNN